MASSVVFRRQSSVFDTTLRYSGDWVALLRIAQSGPFLCVAEELTQWRQHEANSYSRSLNTTREEIRVRRAILKKAWPSDPAIEEGKAICALNLCALYILCGQMKLARHAIDEAQRLAPGNQVINRRRLLAHLPLPLARARLWHGQQVDLPLAEIEALPDITF